MKIGDPDQEAQAHLSVRRILLSSLNLMSQCLSRSCDSGYTIVPRGISCLEQGSVEPMNSNTCEYKGYKLLLQGNILALLPSRHGSVEPVNACTSPLPDEGVS